jgi:hypothetical protein
LLLFQKKKDSSQDLLNRRFVELTLHRRAEEARLEAEEQLRSREAAVAEREILLRAAEARRAVQESARAAQEARAAAEARAAQEAARVLQTRGSPSVGGTNVSPPVARDLLIPFSELR